MRTIALSEWLRPWHGAGVTVFLSEFPLDMSQLSPEFSPSQPGSLGKGQTRPTQPMSVQSQRDVSQSGQTGRSSSQDRNQGRSEAFLSESSLTPRQSSGDSHTASPPRGIDPSAPLHGSPEAPLHDSLPKSRTSVPTQGAVPVKSSLPDPLPLAEWPQAFQDYFQKTSPSPVLWCYESLGDDLFGTPNQERSQCLKRLIGDLRFPKGTSVFWPPAMPGIGSVALSQGVLLQVFQELFPKLVICLGSGPVLGFLSDGDTPLPFTQRLVKGHMVVFLPDFSELVQSEALFAQAVLYLRAIVSQLFIV